MLDYIIGKVIIGGSQFDATLGRFFPVIINRTGITLNTDPSVSTGVTAIVFHNASSAGTDERLVLGPSNALEAQPDSVSSVNNPFLVIDRKGATYLGWILYPAAVSGGTTQPEIDLSSPTGTGNVIYRFETNYMQLLGGATGFAPTLYLLGGDTNIGLNIVPKGTGGLQVGDPATRNVLQLLPGAAAAPAVLNAAGVDTNIDLRLFPKGTGLIDFAIGSTALGGGAAATLGTIGGTGPTAAGQAYWIALRISGTKVWFPVWI